MGVVFLKCCEKKHHDHHHHHECSCERSESPVASPAMVNGARECLENRVSPLRYWYYYDGR
ncbi:hypothetical protein ACQCT5_15370 [Sutcliffiella halmapala]